MYLFSLFLLPIDDMASFPVEDYYGCAKDPKVRMHGQQLHPRSVLGAVSLLMSRPRKVHEAAAALGAAGLMRWIQTVVEHEVNVS